MPERQIVEELHKIITYGGFGAFGGIAVYLNGVRKGKNFKMSMFVINIVLAGFVGWLAGAFIPETLAFKNSLVGISGFLAYPILDILEEKGFIIILNKFIGKN